VAQAEIHALEPDPVSSSSSFQLISIWLARSRTGHDFDYLESFGGASPTAWAAHAHHRRDSLERATFLKKASESASPERVRRVTTSNPGLRQAIGNRHQAGSDRLLTQGFERNSLASSRDCLNRCFL